MKLRTIWIVTAFVAVVVLALFLTQESVAPPAEDPLEQLSAELQSQPQHEGAPLAESLPAESERRTPPSAASEPGGEAVPAASNAEPEASTIWTLVFRAEDGAALDGFEATVTLQWARAEDRPAPKQLEWNSALEADGSARWQLDAAGASFASIDAWAPGYRPTRSRSAVTPGGTTEFVLVPGATVTGLVVDRTGAPVADARVTLSVREDGLAFESLGNHRTDTDGRYRIGTVADGPCLLRAKKSQVGQGTQPVDLAGRVVLEAPTIALAGDGEIVGRVVFAGGSPVPQLRLDAKLLGDAASPGLKSAALSTDESGRFHFRGLVEGEFQIEHALVRNAPDSCFCAEGRVRTGDPEIELTLAAASLDVRAENAAGQPLAFAQLDVMDKSADRIVMRFSSMNPVLSQRLLLPTGSRYELKSEVDGAPLSVTFELEASEERRDVVLRPTSIGNLATVRVRVVGPNDESIERYLLALLREDGHIEAFRGPRDLEDGAFHRIEPGLYEVRLDPPFFPPGQTNYYTPSYPPQVQLIAGGTTSIEARMALGARVELDLESAIPLEDGHAAKLSMWPAGRAIETARTPSVYRHTGQSILSSNSPELGQVWITEEALPPGAWTLRLEATGYRPWERTIALREDETTPVVVELERE